MKKIRNIPRFLVFLGGADIHMASFEVTADFNISSHRWCNRAPSINYSENHSAS